MTTTPLTNANVGVWTPVTGQFTAPSNARVLTIGLFNPNLADRNSHVLTINGSTSADIPETYFLVDDVQMFRIPVAAGPTPCLPNQPITLGTGCPIPGASYEWRQSVGGVGNNQVISTDLFFTVTPSTPTNYTLTVILPDGSTHTTSTSVGQASNEQLTATVNSFTHNGEDVCSYSMLEVSAGQPGTGNAGIWTVDGLAPGEYTDFLDLGTSVQIRPIVPVLYGAPASRNFNLILTINGCQAGAYGFHVVNTFDGVEYCGYMPRQAKVPDPMTAQLYPNPANKNVQFQLKGVLPGKSATMRFYDKYGRLVKTATGMTGSTISIEDLENGIYQVSITVGSSLVKQRLSVER